MEVPGFPDKKVGLRPLAFLSIRTRVLLAKRLKFGNPTRERGLQSAPRLRARVTSGSFPSAARLGRAAMAGPLHGDSNADPKQIASPSQQSSRYCDKPNFPGASLHRC